MENKLQQSKSLQPKTVYTGKWLGVKVLDYEIGGRVRKNWEMVYRTTTQREGYQFDGVETIPIIKYKDSPAKLAMIANFRPPVGKFVLTFPGGLTEKGTLEENSRRELNEETGYTADKYIEVPTPKYYSDPWKSNESSKLMIAVIDGDREIKPVQHLSAGENIRVHLLTIDETLQQQVLELKDKHNYEIESKIWYMLTGIQFLGLVKGI